MHYSVRCHFLWIFALLLATACAQRSATQHPAKAACSGGPHYGVVVTDGSDLARGLVLMGVGWYLDYSIQSSSLPSGCSQALKIKAQAPPNNDSIAATAKASPGSFWIIGNEPNVPGQDDMEPEEYADVFHNVRAQIREADPSARIVAPDVLNFDVTCTGCGGFRSGREWVEAFRASYNSKYGGEPPVDIWSIHTYDLDWTRLPMLDYKKQVQQITAFREYLDRVPAHYGKPIWLTEFAVVWGFDGIKWLPQSNATPESGGISQDVSAAPLVGYPVGELRVDLMAEYMNNMLQWLETNSGPLNIQKWFIFSNRGYKEPWASTSAGVALIEGSGQDAKLTPLGRIYRERASSDNKPEVTPSPAPTVN